MKNPKRIRVLCAALSLLMVLLSLPFAAKAAVLPVDVPIIRLTGGQAPLTDLENGLVYNSAYELNPDAIAGIFQTIQEPLLEAVKKLDWEAVGLLLSDLVWGFFGELQMYPDGTSKNLIYRAGTRELPGLFDSKDYAAPKRQEAAAAQSPIAQASFYAPASFLAPASEEPPPPEQNGNASTLDSIQQKLGQFFADPMGTFYEFYSGVQGYLNRVTAFTFESRGKKSV